MPNDLPEIAITIVAALVLAAVAAVVAFRRGRSSGYHKGYREGWDSMKAAHEEYRAKNQTALATLQGISVPLPSGVSLLVRHINMALDVLADPKRPGYARPNVTIPNVDEAVRSLSDGAVNAVRDHYKIPRHFAAPPDDNAVTVGVSNFARPLGVPDLD